MEIKQINIASNSEGRAELHVLQGSLPEPLKLRERQAYKANGTLSAPLEYFLAKNKYRDENEVNKAVVHVRRQDMAIDFYEDPHVEISDKVTGSVVRNSAFRKMGINDPNMVMTMEEVRSAIRENIGLFPSQDEYRSTLVSLQDVNMKVESSYENAQTNTRTSKAAQHVLANEFSVKFRLKAPVVIGAPDKFIPVEILVVVGPTPKFYFESVELEFAIKQEIDEMFGVVLSKFSEHNVPIIAIN